MLPPFRRPALLLPLLLTLLTAPTARAELPSPQEIAELQSRLEKAHQALDDPKLSLSPSDRALLSVKLTDAERDFREFLKLSHKTPHNNYTSRALLAVGGVVVTDDTTGVGAVDDFLLPFIAVGLYAAHLTQSSADRPAAYMWNVALLQLQIFSAAVTKVAAAQKKPGCRCLCYKKGVGPNAEGGRVPNVEACMDFCKQSGYPGYQCGGDTVWIN